MDARRVLGMVGAAWVIVTAVGVGMFSAAGPPPPFGDAVAYANFTKASSGFFLADAFTTGISAALLLAFFVGLGVVIRDSSGETSFPAALIPAYGVASATILAVVGLFETVTVYVSLTPAHSALAAPLWMLTQTTIVFLYFFGVGVMAALSATIFKTATLPAWTGLVCAICAGLLAVATFFSIGGTGQLGPLGLAMVLVGFFPTAIAVAALSLVLLRSPRR